MKKSIYTLFMCGVLSAAIFTGCGKSNASENSEREHIKSEDSQKDDAQKDEDKPQSESAEDEAEEDTPAEAQPKGIGDSFLFGNYEQDGDLGNGAEALEWIVLDETEDALFVISRYTIDAAEYQAEGTSITWEECSLREWLNQDFLAEAFSDDEQSQILLSTVENPDTVMTKKSYDGSEKTTTTEGGNDVEDFVYLLSKDEAEQYFSSDEERIAYATPYDVQQRQSSANKEEGVWWLRSPGMLADRACNVQMDGTIETRNPVNGGTISIRPVMWIKK